MPNLYTALKNVVSLFRDTTLPNAVATSMAEAEEALANSGSYPGYNTELLHPLDEEALDTVDAKVFNGELAEDEVQRIEYFCRRWLQRCDEVRKFNRELQDDHNR